MAESFALIVVTATVLAFLAHKTKQPTLIAYIAAGIVLGPIGAQIGAHLLGLVTGIMPDPATIQLVSGGTVIEVLSELGLALLLFLIGMEIRFDEIQYLLGPVLKISIPQMVLTALLGFGIAIMFGFPIVVAGVIAVAVMYSSTAGVGKLLADKREHATTPGKLDIGVLLMQDIVVVILMAILTANAATLQQFAVKVLEVFLMLGVIGAVTMASSRYVLSNLFETLAEDLHAFFIHGLAWCFLFIWMADVLNLSIEIGAFLAGLGLAQLPYSNELQERVRPLTDFFIALFFINFGLGLTLESLVYWKEALIAAGILMMGKFVILFVLTDWQKFTPQTSFKTAANMMQTSEFSLIVGSIAVSAGYITEPVLGFLGIIAIVTMGLSSYILNFNHRLYELAYPVLQRFESPEKQDVDTTVLKDHAVIIGYPPLGQRILPAVEDYFDQIMIIDRNPDHADELVESHHDFIYADFRHEDIRHASRIEVADFVVSFVTDHAVNLKILDETNEDAVIFLRSKTLEEATELYELGADYVIHKKVLATSKLNQYIEDYLDNPEQYTAETSQDREMIWWRSHYE
jgi:Kef-type K+ transport system membrane component KefB